MWIEGLSQDAVVFNPEVIVTVHPPAVRGVSRRLCLNCQGESSECARNSPGKAPLIHGLYQAAELNILMPGALLILCKCASMSWLPASIYEIISLEMSDTLCNHFEACSQFRFRLSVDTLESQKATLTVSQKSKTNFETIDSASLWRTFDGRHPKHEKQLL